jgi:dihydroflavonol-4-reductase
MTQNDLALISVAKMQLLCPTQTPELAVEAPTTCLKNKSLGSKQLLNKLATLVILFFGVSTTSFAQYSRASSDSAKYFVSVETDPAFWVGILPNGLGFDANIDFRLAKHPRLRFGVLGYSGKWGGSFGKTVLLTSDFQEDNWVTQWNGVGVEAQYQFGSKRGGLQPGLRMQWNQFVYNQDNFKKGEANHFVMTPQIGFQWFPFKKLGFYILPWAGVQMPILGTNKIIMEGIERNTRKMMPVVTAHVGWEFKF